MKAMYKYAQRVGYVAVEGMEDTIKPMIVQHHQNPLDDSSPIEESYVVPDGPCGIAWINVKPGNSKFANWLKRENLARIDNGGVTIYVREFNQSLLKKEAYATAFASILRGHGVRAEAGSRMD